MGYEIDGKGAARLGSHQVPVPRTISAEAQAFLARAPWGDAPAPEGPIPMWEMRSFVDPSLRALGDDAARRYPVEIEETRIAGVRCHRIRPAGGRKAGAPLLMNLHGGGFVMGSGSLIEAIPIAGETGFEVVAVDYRLAPEHPYPAAVDDALAVYRALLQETPQVGIYGASAGGFLTGQAMARILRDGLPRPVCLGIFTAGGDFRDFGDTAQIFSLSGFWGELILPLEHRISEIRAYLGNADPADPLVSPILGDLDQFPPTLLVTGTRDALLSASAMLHRALRRAGAEADLFVFEAMPHGHWYILDLPEAQEAIDVMSRFFLSKLGTGR